MNKKLSLPFTVLIGSVLASILGAVVAYPGSLRAWGLAVQVALTVILVAGLLLWLVQLTFDGVARKKGRPSPRAWVWAPGLAYIPLAAYSGWLMANAFRIEDAAAVGAKDAGFLAINVGMVWLVATIVVVPAAIIAGVVKLKRSV